MTALDTMADTLPLIVVGGVATGMVDKMGFGQQQQQQVPLNKSDFCKKCDTAIYPDDNFCPNCGMNIETGKGGSK